MFQFEPILKYPIVLFTGLVVSLMLTRFWGPRAPRWGFVDRPSGRKLHQNPTPTAGGLPLFLGVQAAFLMVFLSPWKPFAGQITIDWWYRYAPLSGAVVLLGMVDDRISLKPIQKLLGQVVIGLLAYWVGVRLQNVLGVPVRPWLDLLLTIGWFLVWMNAFNLIDGMDGLATGIALVAAIGMALSLHFRKSPGDVLLLLGFIGACGGFLRYNFYPAKLFLGDTGSLFLGFTLAMLAITTHSRGTFVASIGMPLLAVGIPLFDTVLAVWRRTMRRILNRESTSGHFLSDVSVGDAEHLHHRLLRRGLKQTHVALVLYGATGFFVLIGLLVSLFRDQALGLLILAFLAVSYVVVRHLAWIELEATGEVVVQGISRPIRRNRAMLMYLVADLAILSVTLLITHAALSFVQLEDASALRRVWLRSAPLNVGVPFLFLLMSRSYSRVWHLARVSEYLLTGLAVGVGYVVAAAVSLTGLGSGHDFPLLLVQYGLMIGMAVPSIVGIRCVRRLVLDLLQMYGRQSTTENAIIWGIGFRTTLFLRQCAFSPDRRQSIRMLGAFSHDSALRGHIVHGIRILGGLADVAGFVAEKHVDVIYLVDEVDPDVLAQMKAVSAESPVRIVLWDLTEVVLHG